MFISEMDEAIHYGVNCTEKDIMESNRAFARILSEALSQNYSAAQIFEHLCDHYSEIARDNKVAYYNYERMDFF
jgi:hypothetical protein